MSFAKRPSLRFLRPRRFYSDKKTPSQNNAPSPTHPVKTVSNPAKRSLLQIIDSSPLGRLGRSFANVQRRRPYTTQLSSSFVIFLFGDLSAQLFFPQPADSNSEEGEFAPYDPWRTGRHLVIGVVSSIPQYKWFMFLHRNFNYTSKFRSILTKVAVQQAVFTPVFNTYFFGMQSLLAGGTIPETIERLKKALPVSISNSVKLWPIVTAFSFMYVPPEFRSVFSGIVAVGWQTYLSWLNQKAAQEVLAMELAAAAAAAA
ncbi:hypothetical protein ASPZODRAFT_128596 [Penicilliopsis zonata CBS 506.65]|uniref:Uncharacterized protein n=1 Tax=Penicilliopsis zonata CBS 506.65 TaxID=1073090 RepID=A0A1L9SS37_9EURO|nr:hypothetical protein ASPZODRAFT_128596 [Penicilliopsis zonata CBS 506.65]OJJ50008.1 hypothetical protein ASPZODRAFT_128596 [Penicilliopsis zonata CBS 506.65]